MHPDRVIVCTYKSSGVLYTGQDDQNTLNRKSADTNYDPRDPLHNPVTCSDVPLFVVDGTNLLSGTHPP